MRTPFAPFAVTRGITAAVLLALCALPASAPAVAQDESPAPTTPPRQFRAAKVGVITEELEDPALNRGVSEATARATAAIGAKPPLTFTLPEENALIAAVDLGSEDFGLDIVVVHGIPGPETIDIARSYPSTVYVGVGQGIPCVTADGVPDPSGDCEGDAATAVPNYLSSEYLVNQAAYLAGVVAASATRSGRIGAIGGWPGCTDCNRYIQGFELGARSIDPGIDLRVAYLTDDHPRIAHLDPETGRAFAEAFIDVFEVDVLLAASGGSSAGVIEAACDAGIIAIGTEVDRAIEHPRLARCILTSAMRDVETPITDAIYQVARQFRDQAVFTGGAETWDLENGGVRLAPWHEMAAIVPVEVPNRIESALDTIRTGRAETCPRDCGSPVEPVVGPGVAAEASPAPATSEAEAAEDDLSAQDADDDGAEPDALTSPSPEGAAGS